MPVDPERGAVIATGVRHREEHRDPTTMRGLDRVEISVADLLRYEAQSPREPDGRMRIGEPEERGGDGSGASPLSHFLTGAGSCLLNQLVRCAIAEDLPLEFLGASVRGEFRREAGGRFERIGCEVRAAGTIDVERAEALLARAERLCYIHQTLVAAVEMETSLVVDGREMARHVAGPASGSLSPSPRSPG
jgi:uncharacterized OsmC-like protein